MTERAHRDPDLPSKPRGREQNQALQGVAQDAQRDLPPVLVDQATPELRSRVDHFFLNIAGIFETWVTRCESVHTQRAYRQDVLAFVDFQAIAWPSEAFELLRVSVTDVQGWRDEMLAEGKAPKTLNRRVSSLSSFYKYLAGAAAELRLPITVPNPAHAQFIARSGTDARDETRALTATRARQLASLPSTDALLDHRDRAILKLFLYTGIRIGTACRLRVGDFHQDGDEATLRINEKGKKRRTIGIHFAAAEALREYLAASGITRGPLFRSRLNSRSRKLSERPMCISSMYVLVRGYLERLPGAVKDGRCIYTPHSLRATTATLLLDAGVDIAKVQELLGHRHITTTQIYDKRRRSVSESASHDVPI